MKVAKEGRARALKEAEELIKTAREGVGKYHNEEIDMELDGQIVKKSDTIDEYSQKVEKIKNYNKRRTHFPDSIITEMDSQRQTDSLIFTRS
mgnify:CR=1 FL=1